MSRYIDTHRKWQERKAGPALRWALIVIFPILFILLFVVGPGVIGHTRFPVAIGLPPGLRTAVGAIIGFFGASLYLWTIVLFARAHGTQVPVAPTHGLVTTGPYAVTRNPMVTSGVFMGIGLGLWLDSWSFILADCIAPALYLAYIKLVEEKELAARFGDDYVAYKKSTPFLIPNIAAYVRRRSHDTQPAGE